MQSRSRERSPERLDLVDGNERLESLRQIYLSERGPGSVLESSKIAPTNAGDAFHSVDVRQVDLQGLANARTME